MIVVPPKDHLLLFVELYEGDSADMEVIVFTVPQPLSCLANALLQQLKTNPMLKNDLSNGGDTPNCVKDVARTQQSGPQFAPSAQSHNVLYKLVDNHRRAEVPRDKNLKKTVRIVLAINCNFNFLVVVECSALVFGEV
jgi:hypothetical protein